MQGSPFSPHDDVLRASPETPEETERLVLEVKERARHAFKNKDMMVCEKLYSKALEVEESATMFANRSAVRLTMGRIELSVEDAKKATTLDASYAKGWYRLGQAQERLAKFDDALKAYAKGQELEPDSKVWSGAIQKCSKAKVDWVPPKREEPKIERYEISSRLKQQIQPKEKPCGVKNNEFRGYKLDSQGRKTTYFNRELDDKTKELIGDIAPKKLSQPVEMDVCDGASSWNQAGTFEEKNHTTYARQWFKDKLLQLMVELPELQLGSLKLPRYLTVTAVTDFKGDASTAVARGKKKHLLDIAFTINWEFVLDNKNTSKASGAATFPDITADAIVANDPLEVSVSVDSNTPDYARAIIESHVKSETTGLRPAILSLGGDFLREFKQAK